MKNQPKSSKGFWFWFFFCVSCHLVGKVLLVSRRLIHGLGLQHTPPLPLICQALSSSSSCHCWLCLTSGRVLLSGSKPHSSGIHPWMATLPCLARTSPKDRGYKTQTERVVSCLQGFIPQGPPLNQAGKAKRSLSGIPPCLGICSLQTKARAWRAQQGDWSVGWGMGEDHPSLPGEIIPVPPAPESHI